MQDSNIIKEVTQEKLSLAPVKGEQRLPNTNAKHCKYPPVLSNQMIGSRGRTMGMWRACIWRTFPFGIGMIALC